MERESLLKRGHLLINVMGLETGRRQRKSVSMAIVHISSSGLLWNSKFHICGVFLHKVLCGSKPDHRLVFLCVFGNRRL